MGRYPLPLSLAVINVTSFERNKNTRLHIRKSRNFYWFSMEQNCIISHFVGDIEVLLENVLYSYKCNGSWCSDLTSDDRFYIFTANCIVLMSDLLQLWDVWNLLFQEAKGIGSIIFWLRMPDLCTRPFFSYICSAYCFQYINQRNFVLFIQYPAFYLSSW